MHAAAARAALLTVTQFGCGRIGLAACYEAAMFSPFANGARLNLSGLADVRMCVLYMHLQLLWKVM